jgi:hypothetical protein
LFYELNLYEYYIEVYFQNRTGDALNGTRKLFVSNTLFRGEEYYH